MLVRCLYASRAARPLTETALSEILLQSRKNNPRNGITGMLCFANNFYIQVIEGGRPAVSDLLCKIVRDERNSELQVLADSFDPQREDPSRTTRGAVTARFKVRPLISVPSLRIARPSRSQKTSRS